jgi:hypothetical protein
MLPWCLIKIFLRNAGSRRGEVVFRLYVHSVFNLWYSRGMFLVDVPVGAVPRVCLKWTRKNEGAQSMSEYLTVSQSAGGKPVVPLGSYCVMHAAGVMQACSPVSQRGPLEGEQYGFVCQYERHSDQVRVLYEWDLCARVLGLLMVCETGAWGGPLIHPVRGVGDVLAAANVPVLPRLASYYAWCVCVGG